MKLPLLVILLAILAPSAVFAIEPVRREYVRPTAELGKSKPMRNVRLQPQRSRPQHLESYRVASYYQLPTHRQQKPKRGGGRAPINLYHQRP